MAEEEAPAANEPAMVAPNFDDVTVFTDSGCGRPYYIDGDHRVYGQFHEEPSADGLAIGAPSSGHTPVAAQLQ